MLRITFLFHSWTERRGITLSFLLKLAKQQEIQLIATIQILLAALVGNYGQAVLRRWDTTVIWKISVIYHQAQSSFCSSFPSTTSFPTLPAQLSCCPLRLEIGLCEIDSSILQAVNYSSHLPLIPLPLWRLHRRGREGPLFIVWPSSFLI